MTKNKKKGKRLLLDIQEANDRLNYEARWPIWSLSTPPKNNKITAVYPFVRCRDTFLQDFRMSINDKRELFYSDDDYDNNDSIEELGLDLRKVRVLTFASVNSENISAKSTMEAINIYVKNAIKILNAIEKEFGIPKTIVRKPVLYGDYTAFNKNIDVRYFLGNKIWHCTSYHLYAYLLIIRSTRDLRSKLINVNTLDEVIALYNDTSATEDIRTVRKLMKVIDILLGKVKELVGNNTIEYMWDVDRLEVKHRDDDTGYGEGITVLMAADSYFTELQSKFNELCKEKGLLIPIRP